MARYQMTARRRAALRKAQLASARKRKGRGKKKRTTLAQRQRRLNQATLALAGASVAVGAGVEVRRAVKTNRRIKHHKAFDAHLKSMNYGSGRVHSTRGVSRPLRTPRAIAGSRTKTM